MTSADGRFSAAVDRAYSGLGPGSVELTACVADTLLRFRFPSPEIAALFTAALEVKSVDSPALEICIVPAGMVDFSGLLPNRGDETLVVANDDIYVLWQPGPVRVLHIFDFATRRGVIALIDDIAPHWLRSRPHVPIMHAFLHRTSWVGLHSAAVGRDERMLLLCGPRKSGKSTAAIACARAGWRYAGDDTVLVHSDHGTVAPFAGSARLRDDVSRQFPDLMRLDLEMSSEEEEIRHELRLAEHLPMSRVAGGKIAAILLTQRMGAALPTFKKATPRHAMTALLSSLMLVPGWRQETAVKLMAVSTLAPVYLVDTGMSAAAIPDAFGRLLDGL